LRIHRCFKIIAKIHLFPKSYRYFSRFLWSINPFGCGYRTRYFTDSGIIGTKDFVEMVYSQFIGYFSPKHGKKPKDIKGLEEYLFFETALRGYISDMILQY